METEIASLISSIGFPIVAFYLMYKMVNQQMKDNTEAINNNTKMMTKLLAHFNLDGDGNEE